MISIQEQQADERLHRFRQRRDSLRLHASRVAALSGFNPFANLPELLIQLVYQGPVGQQLLRQDARALGIVFQSEEAMLRELAAKAGADTAKALQTALDVKKGKKVMDTVRTASKVKKMVIDQAMRSKKLSAQELNVLQEGVRSSVDTGYGTHHEDEALNLYEKQCGWEVRDRNSQVLSWPFAKAEDVDPKMAEDQPTAVPLSRPIAVWTDRHNETSTIPQNSSSKKNLKPSIESDKEAGATIDAAESESDKAKMLLPFFSISGAVDGIRDELWCPPLSSKESEKEDEDDWVLRSIIVECKHRMKRSFRSPPLYDQIQTTVYCLMHDVDAADLIQVVRNEKCREKRKPRNDSNGESRGEENRVPSKKNKAATIATSIQDTLPNVRLADEGRDVGDASCASSAKDKESNTRSRNTDLELRSNVAMASLEVQNNEIDITKAVNTVENAAAAAPATHSRNKNPSSLPSPDLANQDDSDDITNSGVIHHQQQPTVNVEIDVYRVAMDDPVMQHRQNWRTVILPRLRSFVDAVYNIRQDDAKRYSLLQNSTSPSMGEGTDDYDNDMSAAWDLLHSECPWLQDCDTAFRRPSNVQVIK